MKPYYEHNGITIYHGNCVDALLDIQDTYDLLLNDPPYNYGLKYDGYADDLPRDEYHNWCATWYHAARRITKRAIIFPGNGNLDIWMSIAHPSGVGCWYKPGNPASSVLGWDEWEPWLYWGTRLGGSSVIKASISKQVDTENHPCPKPLELITKLIKKTKATSVVDTFMGSGTTLLAAQIAGIPAIGIDQSERYCEIAVNRLRGEKPVTMHVNGETVNAVQSAIQLF